MSICYGGCQCHDLRQHEGVPEAAKGRIHKAAPEAAMRANGSILERGRRNWIRQADLDTGLRADGLTTEEREELRRLGRENRILREEREILEKRPPSSPGRPARSSRSVRVRAAGE